MELSFAYRRRSAVQQSSNGLAIALAPNLRRDCVSYRGHLIDAISFREAISALHDIVINDLRYQPRDRSAYEAYRKNENERLSAQRREAAAAKSLELKALLLEPMPTGLESDFRRSRDQYWNARQQYSNYLLKHDRDLWRLLMPCDPVITVANDCLFFECFSADESSYGCLSVDRDAFQNESDVALGTTNVDYSWGLYEHFQKLRSYRKTEFSIDPSGFDVRTQGADEHREEKIELPNSTYQGKRAETIRIWGRDRLKVLARILPLIESVDVHLLGTGLPSFWVVRMRGMRLVLALSGWTVNNWTGASALQQLAPPGVINEPILVAIAAAFRDALWLSKRKMDSRRLSNAGMLDLRYRSAHTACTHNAYTLIFSYERN
ncbi:MAG: hypothetical protein ABL921_03430 [Pirellula sp.]